MKLILGLPALAIAFSACNDDQEPFLDGYVMGFAVQVEDPSNHGSFHYIPDVRAATASTSDVINPTLKRGGVFMNLDTPFRDAYENRIGHATFDDGESSITLLNGKYTFSARNTEMRDITASYTWKFIANSGFSEGWGENPDPAQRYEADHYTRFDYDGTWVRATVLPFVDDRPVYYYLMNAQYMQISPAGNTDPVMGPIEDPESFTLSRSASYFVPESQDPVYPGSDLTKPIELSWYLPKNQYHGTRIAIVAIKDVPESEVNGTYRGTVMLRTEFKTITKEKPVFYEDTYPVVSIAVDQDPVKKTYEVDEEFDPTGMVIKVTYGDGSSATISAEELSDDKFDYDFTTAGSDKTVTVTYRGRTTVVTGITVINSSDV